MPELEKIEIAKTEYEILLRDSQKLKELKPIVNDLNSKIKQILE